MYNYTLYPSLKNKAVFITGGGSGIGACFVEAFFRQGARVGFIDIDMDAAGRLISSLQPDCDHSIWYRDADVTDIDLFQDCIRQFSETAGGLHVLVNNVANDSRHSTLDVSADEWKAGLTVNLDAAFFASQAALKIMRPQKDGAIIFMSSINALSGMTASMPGYISAKAGILGLSKAISREFGHLNIRSNAIVPGWVATDRQLQTWLTPEAEEEFLKTVSLRRRLQPEAIASAALFLASQDAAMITGQQLVIDGGYL